MENFIFLSSSCLFFEETSILDVWSNPEPAFEFSQYKLTITYLFFVLLMK